MTSSFTGRKTREAFTLVELLVVVAIIGVLVGMLLPAIKAAREAANRMECANNLHQLAIATQAYHDAAKKLPALAGAGNYSIFVPLLPYIEQAPLADAIHQFGTPRGNLNSITLTLSPPWRDVQIPSLLCPSGYYAETIHPSFRTGATSYFASSGDFPVCADGPILANAGQDGLGRGPFRVRLWNSMSRVKDGTSNTAAFSERIIGRVSSGGGGKSLRMVDTYIAMAWKSGTNMNPDPTEAGGVPLYPSKCLEFIGLGGDYIQPMPTGSGLAINSLQGRNWVNGDALSTCFNTIMPPNGPACSSFYAYVAGPTSNHTGGCNVCFLDGSVRFVNETVDTGDLSTAPIRKGESPYGVWGAMGSAEGRDIVN